MRNLEGKLDPTPPDGVSFDDILTILERGLLPLAEDAFTVREVCEAVPDYDADRECDRRRVIRALRVLQRDGRLEVVSKRVPDITGRVHSVPAYRIKKEIA